VGGASGAQLGSSLTLYVITYAGMFLAYMVVLTHLGEGDPGMSLDLPLGSRD